MDPVLILPLIVTLWCVVTIVHTVRAVRSLGSKVRAHGFAIKIAIVLACIWTGTAIGSEPLVYAAAIAWLVLLFAPLQLAAVHARALAARDYRRARRFARVIRLLHPFDGWRGEPAMLSLLDDAHSGDADAIDALRRRCSEGDGLRSSRAFALLEIARLTGDWDGLLAMSTDADEGPSRLRALGETGRLDELVDLHARLPADPGADLMLFAFAGRIAGVEAILETAGFATLADKHRDFWRATAMLAGNPADEPAQALLRSSADGEQFAALAARRLAGGLASPATLSAGHRAMVAAREDAVLADKAAGRLPPAPPPYRVPIATLILIAPNVAAFGWQIWRGGWQGFTDPETLFDLGGLWAPAVVEGGEWSRLVTALFLHAGILHLGLNMLALFVIGRLLEQVAERWFLVMAYLIAGVGSMAGVVLIHQLFGGDPEVLVGASGAVLGLFGTYAGMLLRNARRAPYMWPKLRGIALILGVQVVFDLLIPQVSLAAHACGMAIGFVIGLARGWPSRNARHAAAGQSPRRA